jgi:ABC-type transporter Mla MlaB component
MAIAAADDFEANTVTLTGPITLYESAEVRESLLAAVAEGKPLRIDLGLSGPWDLAGFQLLIALMASGEKAGLPVRLAHVPGVCREVAERAGLADWLAVATESFA